MNVARVAHEPAKVDRESSLGFKEFFQTIHHPQFQKLVALSVVHVGLLDQTWMGITKASLGILL